MADQEPKALLRRALAFLDRRDFSSSQKLAAEAMQLASDPTLAAGAGRILTVARILLAGHRRDLYAVLRVTRAESEESQLLWSRYAELAETLAEPELNGVALAQEAYDVAFDAFSVLSDPEMKSQYDAETGNAAASASASFWTVCPYCFWLFQYGKVYEDRCLRCQNCSRAFHGVVIGDPPAEIVVTGKDQYFVCHGVFPLGYMVKQNVRHKEKEEEEEEEEDEGIHSGSERCRGKRVAKAPARRMKNVKSVAAKKMKKTMSVSELEEEEEEEKINGGGCDLVYFEGHDDDLFVDLEDLDIPN